MHCLCTHTLYNFIEQADSKGSTAAYNAFLENITWINFFLRIHCWSPDSLFTAQRFLVPDPPLQNFCGKIGGSVMEKKGDTSKSRMFGNCTILFKVLIYIDRHSWPDNTHISGVVNWHRPLSLSGSCPKTPHHRHYNGEEGPWRAVRTETYWYPFAIISTLDQMGDLRAATISMPSKRCSHMAWKRVCCLMPW